MEGIETKNMRGLVGHNKNVGLYSKPDVLGAFSEEKWHDPTSIWTGAFWWWVENNLT